MLQTRNAKRPAQAAVRVAVDMVDGGPADARRRRSQRIDADKLDALLHPTFDPRYEYEPLARGVPASPGAAKGAIVFTADEAVERAADGRGRDPRAPIHRGRRRRRASTPRRASSPRRAARPRTPRWSRAGWAGRACAAPPSSRSTSRRGTVRGGRHACCAAGDLIAIDGTTGDGHDRGRAARRRREIERALRDRARLGRRAPRGSACARTPTRPRTRAGRASFGAEGIGLCRTEHMFMRGRSQPKMRAMIMADSEERAPRGARRAAAAPAGATSRASSRRWRACRSRSGCSTRRCTSSSRARRSCWSSSSAPARRRPRRRADRRARGAAAPRARARGDEPDARHARLPARDPLSRRSTRCRCARSSARRSRCASARGAAPERRDHDPAGRLRAGAGADARRSSTRGRRARSRRRAPSRSPYTVGTMIELPRACLVADRIADHADFFSFGTNDLTQTALGFSRDDVEGEFLDRVPRAAGSSTAARSRRSTCRASARWCGSAVERGPRGQPEL